MAQVNVPKGTTAQIAQYISSVQSRELPQDVLEKTKCHLLDSLAAVISGSRLKAGRLATQFVETLGGKPESRVWGTDIVTSAVHAALANGMSGHADETDDSHLGGRFHPGCAIVPAAMAIAERQNASGLELLKAVAAGYDIGARFTIALGYSGPRTGTHSTHSLGALFGSTAAAGSLLDFDPIENASLISYAVQQASGIPYWERDSEHVEKAFDFGGMGARNGVYSALMVASGMSGVQDPLEGKLNYLTAIAENPQPDALAEALGHRYEIMAASIKKWCVGSPIQAALDASMALLSQGLDVADIEKIELIMPDDRLVIVNNRNMPDVCLQHLVAVCLIDGGLTFATCHDKARMEDPEVLALREKMTAIPSPELTVAKPARQAIVEVTTKQGSVLRHHTKAVLGTPDNPMSPEEVKAKAADLIEPILGKEKSDKLIEALWHIETLENVNELQQYL